MTKKTIAEIAKPYDVILEGCGDSSCMLAKVKGMSTNGGCCCFENMKSQPRMKIQNLIRLVKILHTEIESLLSTHIVDSKVENNIGLLQSQMEDIKLRVSSLETNQSLSSCGYSGHPKIVNVTTTINVTNY